MNASDALVIPPFTLPFPQQLHPDAPRAADHARAWAARTGLYASAQLAERAYSQQCDQFAAWVYPTAPRDRLNTLSCLDLMMFLDDDHADEEAPRPHALTQTPLLSVIEKPMGPAWRARFRAHLADWNQVNIEAGIRRRQSAVPPAPGDYIPWRRISSTLLWHFDLIEYAQGHELADDFVAGSLYRSLIDCAADIAAWTNDLFSAPKELAAGEPNNLLAVLAHHDGLSLQQAAAVTVDLIADRVRHFQAARAALVLAVGDGSPAVNPLVEWADGVGRWAGGNLGFCRVSGRYPARS
ncbi:terpene synthase family protein [Streptomyces sp. NRRL S-350]|uniref:terpene synthase family protein n=1 Tax=Streptomyces sp. NRRL S-350 TaxID=1463902 RepID=UPI00131E5A0C|nr:terpene synthase family protein [Streptomyces sp. NRRL S-350]